MREGGWTAEKVTCKYVGLATRAYLKGASQEAGGSTGREFWSKMGHNYAIPSRTQECDFKGD